MRPGPSWHSNLGLKLLSLSLALCLWLYVHGIKTVERELLVPLHVEGLPDSLMLLVEPPGTARVLVSGQAQELLFRRFAPGAEMRLDLSRARVPLAQWTPSLSDVQLGANQRLTLLRIIEPTSLELPVDRRVQRTLPVQVVMAGTLPEDRTLQRTPRATPATVRCTGASSSLAGRDSIPTHAVDLTGKRDAIQERVGLDVESALVTCEPDLVTVDASVVPRRTRVFADRPITIQGASENDWLVEVHPARVTLALSGSQEDLESLAPGAVGIVLDVRRLGPGTHQDLKLAPRLPAWAKLAGLEPAAVDVVIRRRHH